MKFFDLVNLIGLKSTETKVVDWFEANNLGKVPKTVNANQREKGASDKTNLITYTFGYNIKNDLYYPPVSPKNNNYDFDCFMTCIVPFNFPYNKKKFEDPKPLDFWEGFIHPKSSFEECLAWFDGKVHESMWNGEINLYFFEKKLSDLAKVEVYYKADKSRISDIQIQLVEDSEYFSYMDFSSTNTYNTTKQAYTLLAKWLFDNQYLKPNEAFPKQLSFDHNSILDFVANHLKNHIWASQLTEEPLLRRFLSKIHSNSSISTANGEMNVFIQHLFVKASGKWNEHQKIYENNFSDIDAFEASIVLDEPQSKLFLNTLSEMFVLFKDNIQLNVV